MMSFHLILPCSPVVIDLAEDPQMADPRHGWIEWETANDILFGCPHEDEEATFVQSLLD